MRKKAHSETGFSGIVTHYDEKGKKIGESRPDLFGDYTNYDAKGRKIGESRRTMLGNYENYDSKGNKIGTTQRGILENTYYDHKGRRTGSSAPYPFSSSSAFKSEYSQSDQINSMGGDAAIRNEKLEEEWFSKRNESRKTAARQSSVRRTSDTGRYASYGKDSSVRMQGIIAWILFFAALILVFIFSIR